MNPPTELTPESPDEELTPQQIAKAQALEPQDIDPAQWLTASATIPVGYVNTKAGRLKIAALTEKESDAIRRASQSPVPGKPQQRQLNLKKLRLATVAASVNKAYGYTPADPRFIQPEQMEVALSGEITTIVSEISKLSGFVEDSQESPGEFFQIS